MSKFRFRDKARRFRARKAAALERMANNAVYEFKVVSFDRRSFDGNLWAPLKNPTGRQPLVKTGRMRESITIISRSEDMRRVGSLVPYAAYHNAGTKTLPKRQFIGNNRSLERKNAMVLRDYLRGR